MATVRNTFVLEDKMTSVLMKINKAMYSTLSVMKKMGANSKDLAPLRAQLKTVNDSLRDVSLTSQKLKTPLNRVTKELKEQATAWQKIKASLVGRFAIGNLVAMMAWQAIGSFKEMVQGAIDYASSLVEFQNVIDVAYGKSAGVVDKWSKTTLKAYGINELNAKQYAGTLSSQLQASGIAQKKAGDMAMALTGLTGDIASFRNEDIAVVFKKISSGLAGMVMPLRRYGFDLTVATMQEYAYTKGIHKKWKAMTQAEKVQLRYNYLMEKTQQMGIQGDFVKTQYTFANQLRLLGQNWQELSGAMATSFLPVLNLCLIGLNKLMDSMKDLAKTITPYIPAIAGIATALTALIGLMVGSWLIEFIAGVWRTIQAFYLLQIGIRSAGIAMITWFGSGAGAITLVALAMAGVIWTLHKFGFTYTQIFSGFIATLYGVGSVIYDWLGAPLQFVITKIQELKFYLDALSQSKMSDWGNVIGRINKNADFDKMFDERKPWEKTKDSWNTGMGKGKELAQALKLQMHFPNKGTDPSSPGKGAPGSSKSNPLYAKLDDSDINALVELAKVNYVNKYITQSPVIQAQFGDIHQNADAKGVLSVIAGAMEEARDSALGQN